MTRVLFLSAALAVSSCSDSVIGPTVSLNTEFVLALDKSAKVESMVVRFLRVRNDSRCPADVFCIQGGDALVQIAVSSPRGHAEYDLHTGSMQPVTHDDLTIHLVQLAPYPFSSRTIAQDEYRATLRVTR